MQSMQQIIIGAYFFLAFFLAIFPASFGSDVIDLCEPEYKLYFVFAID